MTAHVCPGCRESVYPGESYVSEALSPPFRQAAADTEPRVVRVHLYCWRPRDGYLLAAHVAPSRAA